jgi:hypothetical protein
VREFIYDNFYLIISNHSDHCVTATAVAMDIVGLVASVITLTQVVIEGVKLAKTLYKAPEDLAALQVS